MGIPGSLFVLVLIVGTLFFSVAGGLKDKQSSGFFQLPKFDLSNKMPELPTDMISSKLPDSLTAPVLGRSSFLSSQGSVQPPKGFTTDKLSPYYKMIRISSIQPGYSFLSRGSFTLYSLDLVKPVSITGWRLKSNSGFEVALPKGVIDYQPKSAFEGDILMEKSMTLYAYTNQSAIGRNLRMNKCTGYLNNLYNFQPRLPANCPSIDRNVFLTLPGRCQTFSYSVGTCEEPNDARFRAAEMPQACIDYVRKMTGYGNCYERYRRDADFFSNIWYVWLDQWLLFDKEHDRVLFFDKDGLLVDEYIY